MLPEVIINQFKDVNPDADEAYLYGPWNTVLGFCFPFQEGYMVAPQYPVGQLNPGQKDTVDFVMILTVMKKKSTIFFVEIKAPKYLSQLSARADADIQMRKRLYQLYDGSPSHLHGVSAFGTHVCFYKHNKHKNAITPSPAGEWSPLHIVDTAPADRWSLDILEGEGFRVFMEAVESAKAIGVSELEDASTCTVH